MSKNIEQQYQDNQRALEEFQKVWDGFSSQEKTSRRIEWANRLERSLPHTSAALRNNVSNEELEVAIRKDGLTEQLRYIQGIQDQATLILQLLLEKGDPLSFVNMGEVWKPNQEDFERAFIEDAQRAYQTYSELWSTTPVAMPKDGQDKLLIQAATPKFISEARFFPSGYARCVHRFHPDTVWVSWKYVRDGQSNGMAYNGLAWLGDRFKWFPKPWRLWS